MSRICTRSGILLPIALLLLLAVTATATSILLLARTELLLERGDHTHLRSRIDAESRLAAAIAAGNDGEGAVEGVIEYPLEAGFSILRTAGAGESPQSMALSWRLIPDSLLYDFPGAIETGGTAPGSGVRAMTPGEGCAPAGSQVLVRIREPAALPLPNPPLPPPPRLGLLGVEELAEVADASLLPGEPLPSSAVAHGLVLVSPAGGRIQGGEASGVLVAPWDLHLGGGARFRGIALVRGDLVLDGGSTIEGVALVGGRVQLNGGSILGCPSLAAEALDLPALTRPRTVRGGELLGRF